MKSLFIRHNGFMEVYPGAKYMLGEAGMPNPWWSTRHGIEYDVVLEVRVPFGLRPALSPALLFRPPFRVSQDINLDGTIYEVAFIEPFPCISISEEVKWHFFLRKPKEKFEEWIKISDDVTEMSDL